MALLLPLRNQLLRGAYGAREGKTRQPTARVKKQPSVERLRV
jgi:hypothetical protein